MAEPLSDDALRALYARATAARRDPARAGCPAPEALLALVRREGPEAVRLETLDHAMSCADCRADFELLRAIEGGRRREAGDAVRQLRWRRPLGVALGAIAAALLLAIVLPRAGWWPGKGGGEVMRGDTTAIVAAPADGATVSGDSVRFAWHPVAGARRYALEVLTPDGASVVAHETTDTSFVAARASLDPGDYRWSVTAMLPGGAVRSTTRRLRVAR